MLGQTEVDVEDPDKPIRKFTISKNVKRKPIPTGTGSVPNQTSAPAPASRNGTHRARASSKFSAHCGSAILINQWFRLCKD
jgi:hypothetical protein